jgi:hypothetical protein
MLPVINMCHLKGMYFSLLINIRETKVNKDFEKDEANDKKAKLPKYETERDYYLRKLEDNYGLCSGFFAGIAVPKIPVLPEREKKSKDKEPPEYSA